MGNHCVNITCPTCGDNYCVRCEVCLCDNKLKYGQQNKTPLNLIINTMKRLLWICIHALLCLFLGVLAVFSILIHLLASIIFLYLFLIRDKATIVEPDFYFTPTLIVGNNRREVQFLNLKYQF